MCFKKNAYGSAVMHHIGFAVFWALKDNVGYGYKNNPSDVMLVQFFINMANMEKYMKTVDYTGAGFRGIEEDGKFGGETWGAIKAFQKSFGGFGDGMVSAASGDRLTSPKSGRVYTLLELNRLYAHYRRYAFNDLKCDQYLPIGLFEHFTTPDFASAEGG